MLTDGVNDINPEFQHMATFIWASLLLIYWSYCYFKARPTFSLQMPWFGCTIKSELVFHLEWSIPAVDTLQWHQYCSRSHHTQSPTHCLCRSPLYPHLGYYSPPVAVVQLSMELQCTFNCIANPSLHWSMLHMSTTK